MPTQTELVARFRAQGVDQVIAACNAVEARMNGVASRMRTLSGSLTSFGIKTLAGLTALAGGAMLAARSGLELEIRYEQAVMSLTVLLRSSQAAQAAMRRLAEEATRSQMELTDMIPTFKTLAAVYYSAFRDPERAVRESFRTLKVWGDTASVLGANAEQLAHAMYQFNQLIARPIAGLQDLREMAIAIPALMPLARIREEFARMGKAIPSGEQAFKKAGISGLEAAQALIRSLERDFGGAQERMVNTFTGVTSNLRDAWANLTREMSKPLLTPITAVLKVIKDQIESLATSPRALSGLKVAISELAAPLIYLTAVLIATLRVFNRLPESTQHAIARFASLSAMILGLVAGLALLSAILIRVSNLFISLGGAVLRFVRMMAQAVGWLTGASVLARMGPWAIVIGAIIAGLVLIIRYWDQVRHAVIVAGDAIYRSLNWLATRIIAVVNAISKVPQAIASFSVQPIVQGYRDILRQYGDLERQHTRAFEEEQKRWTRRMARPAERAISPFAIPGELVRTTREVMGEINKAMKAVSFEDVLKGAEELANRNKSAARSTAGLADETKKKTKAHRDSAHAIRGEGSAIDELRSAFERVQHALQATSRYELEALDLLSRYADGARYVQPLTKALALRELGEGTLRLEEEIQRLRVLFSLADRLGDLNLAQGMLEWVPPEALRALGLGAEQLDNLIERTRELATAKQELAARQAAETERTERLNATVDRTVRRMYLVLAGFDEEVSRALEAMGGGQEQVGEALARVVQDENDALLSQIRYQQRVAEATKEGGEAIGELARQYRHLPVAVLRAIEPILNWTEYARRAKQVAEELSRSLLGLRAGLGEGALARIPTEIREPVVRLLPQLDVNLREQILRLLEPLSELQVEVAPSTAVSAIERVLADVRSEMQRRLQLAESTERATEEEVAYAQLLAQLSDTLLRVRERAQELATQQAAETRRAQEEYQRGLRQIRDEDREQTLTKRRDLRGLLSFYREQEKELLIQLALTKAASAPLREQLSLEQKIAETRRKIDRTQAEIIAKSRRFVREIEEGLGRAFENFFERILAGMSNLRDAFRSLLDEIRRAIARAIAEWIVERVVAWWRRVVLGRREEQEETVGRSLRTVAGSILKSGGVLNTALAGIAGVLISGKLTLGKALAALALAIATQAVVRPRRAGWLGVIAGLVGGFLQKGGKVEPQKLYVVGERGPELFVPQVSGQVVPNAMLRQLAITKPSDIKIEVAAHFYGDIHEEADVNRMADQLASSIVRRLRTVQ